MATDWAADVKKYVAKADDAAIAGIVKYCGIALRNRDSALVSFSDKAETDRVRTNFLKKKLALTQADSVLDAAIAKVAAQMKADRTKNRVTVYYLLAREFKQLGQFVKSAPAAKKLPATKAPTKAETAKAPATTTAAKPAAKTKSAPKPKMAAKAVGAAALVAGATAAAKAKPAKPVPAKVATNKTAVTASVKKAAAPAKKIAAPTKKAPPAAKVNAATAKATTAKAATPANNATQGLLDKAASTASDTGKAADRAPAPVMAATAPAAAASAVATAGMTDKVGTATPNANKTSAGIADDGSEMGWLWWVIGLAVLAFVAWFLFARGPDAPDTNATEAAASAAASDVGTDLAAAPREGTAAIPAGAGVTSELRDGKPVVKVYFDTAKAEVTPVFAKTASGLREWLDTHSRSVVAISGYSDPSGNAAANAELSKQRAQAVLAALVAAGIPAEAIMLVKPEVSADASVSAETARRVEVVVK
jgi:outer membrane protein OmpA-like peptidoglycan-associated protein